MMSIENRLRALGCNRALIVLMALGFFAPMTCNASFLDDLKAAAQKLQQVEQQKNSQQQPPQNPLVQDQPQASPSQYQPPPMAGGSADQGSGPIPDSECCTAEAMKKYAKHASFLDIVGIKLGMTPKEAFAAVHAFNPKLRIDIAKGTLVIPGEPARENAVMRYATARTVGVRPYSTYPAPFALPDGSSDEIVMVFTTPPNPPLLAKVTRHIVFPRGKPVLASKLLGALRKKYGHESYGQGQFWWIYDGHGKLLTRQLTGQESVCPSGVYSGLGFGGQGSMPTPDNVTEGPQLGWEQSLDPIQGQYEAIPACIPFTIAMAGDSADNLFSPNAQSMSLTVSIESPALLYAGWRSSQEWLRAKADAIKRKEENAVKQNTAPSL
jgi:hypothetical protein